jgi:hypothetical protein
MIGPRSFVSSSRWLLPIGAATLVLGVVVSLRMVGEGVDFPVLYVMGRALLHGTNVYLPEATATFPQEFGVPPAAMLYPPATGFLIVPLALLPFAIAKWTFALVIDAAVILGIRALVRAAAPKASSGVWMLAAGIAMASAAMRWGLMLLQVAPLILGLLCWFVGLLHTGRSKAAVLVAVAATTLKMTLALPFVGLLALRRRWSSVIAVGTAWIAANAVAFWRMGPDSFAAYQRSIRVLGNLSDINSPDLWRPVALPRLDWMPLFYTATANMTLANVVALALSGACFLWLAWQALRSPRPDELSTTALFLGALVCLGSLAVYHHQYDAILFFAPVLVALLADGVRIRRDDLRYWLAAPLLLMILLLPIGKAQAVMAGAVGLVGVAVVKLAFPVAFTLALVGCLLLISSRSAEPAA